ncbi:MAG TPA: phosphatidylglycerophosphatase A [Smithellaceae bacterium]|nr:phosphatidylglycerophosphatase A [Smithellaceae bacterium]
MKDKVIKFLATGFCAGYIRFTPGTMGTIVGIPIYLAYCLLPMVLRIIIVLALLALSIYISGRAEKLFKKKDDQRIVIDEIIGLQITMLPAAVMPLSIFIGFVLFRVFDILKPYPLHRLQKLPGGWGVVLDDVGAGIYAGALMMLLLFLGVI